ncbi:LuxR family transcriptional regulator [Nakamurella sp. YIM 132087]|uniref:LuxR family transcriptional regulator n=1 Tax=Nakamurella alba TaxID=2665158 RepID=A0A7K1FLK0_9ACTN|nr:helix-turn-helix transcriptional regulator [Nakamurella alba]MTD15022.1 LuxR family transcriptional regulator [Nakamurella alba]
MKVTTRRPLDEILVRELAPDADRNDVADAVYAVIRQRVPFDFACLATTDPATGLVTWASKTRDLGVGDEEFSAQEYGPPDVNRFVEIAQRAVPVGVLSVDTDGHPERCRRHREFNHLRFGFTDEIRVVFRSRGVAWGAIGLYRGPGDPPFTAKDGAEVVALEVVVAEALQRSMFRPGARQVLRSGGEGPAVLIIDAQDRVTQLTPAAADAIEQLGGYDHGSPPANILAVVAHTRTSGAPTDSRTQVGHGWWLSLRAAPLSGPPGGNDVVVTIEPTPHTDLSRLTLAAHGLTTREEDVTLLVLQGASTRAIATSLHLSPHTVQDHLKKIFGKLGVNSRRDLAALLTGG